MVNAHRNASGSKDSKLEVEQNLHCIRSVSTSSFLAFCHFCAKASKKSDRAKFTQMYTYNYVYNLVFFPYQPE